MAGAEAEGWTARVQVVPVVVIEGDAEVALVFVTIAVRVADQRGLPVVVDEGVGDSDKVGGVGELLPLASGLESYMGIAYVDESIVVVLVVVAVRRDVAVVDPDVVGFF